MTPNPLAYLVLLSWPLVTFFLFTRMPPARAVVITMIAGILLMPARLEVDLPIIPPFNRETVPYLSALLCCVLGIGGAGLRPGRRNAPQERQDAPAPGWLPESTLQRLLLLVFLIQPVVTMTLNREPLVYGPTELLGMVPYDALSAILDNLIAMLPMLLGRRYLRRAEDVTMLMRILVFALLLYTIPIMVELRLSPQIHRWVYGYFPTAFIQSMRDGGFRPQVLLNHGLALALLLAMAIMAASSLTKTEKPDLRGKARMKAGWLTLILVLCKSLGATLMTFFAAPLILFAGKRLQITAAAGLALLTLLYPLARSYDLVPTEKMVAAAGHDRGRSLEFRFDNEDILLEKASHRLYFGWGGWSRARVFHPVTGEDVSVTDGAWIIALGSQGLVGFIARFGLLASPLLLLWFLRKRPDLGQETAGLSLILAINLVDLLPNSSEFALTWLYVGTLTGRIEELKARVATTASAAPSRGVWRKTAAAPVDPVVKETAQASPESSTDAGPAAVRGRPAHAEPVRPGLGGVAERRPGGPARRG